jgi:dihydrofolate synthase/folylpolyglutamate synthase
LGGRLDATNVVTPAVVALTTVELDHVDVLGATLEAIAAEKAGVMKRGIPAVTAPQDAAVTRVFREAAARAGTPLAVAGEDFRFAPRGDGGFDFQGARYEMAAVRPAMRGPAQLVNGAVALATLERFRPFDVPAAAARAGVEAGVARARLELFAGAPAVLVDTAHTAASAAALAAVIRELGHDDAVLVWGMSADKDVDAFARALAPVTAVAIATAAATPRARAAAELAAAATVFRRQEVCPSTAAALARARALAGPSGLVVVAGSFYVAGEALVALEGTVA